MIGSPKLWSKFSCPRMKTQAIFQIGLITMLRKPAIELESEWMTLLRKTRKTFISTTRAWETKMHCYRKWKTQTRWLKWGGSTMRCGGGGSSIYCGTRSEIPDNIRNLASNKVLKTAIYWRRRETWRISKWHSGLEMSVLIWSLNLSTELFITRWVKQEINLEILGTNFQWLVTSVMIIIWDLDWTAAKCHQFHVRKPLKIKVAE